jgi:amino acid adenylation domain-containing protein
MKARILQYHLNESLDCFKENTAIEQGSSKLTYNQLDRESNAIANWIINRGIQKESFIAVLIEDRLQFIVTLIGILRAGCAVMPLDSVYPPNRLEMMVCATDTRYVITDEVNFAMFNAGAPGSVPGAEIIRIDSLLEERNQAWFDTEPGIQYSEDDKIYIYFTSGSTGTPKAMVGKNKSLTHFIQWEIETFDLDADVRISQFTSPGFDAFLRDVFVPLCAGGTICIPPQKEIILQSDALVDWIDNAKISLIHCVPSLFRLMTAASENQADSYLTTGHFKELKYVLMSGEPLQPSDLVVWYAIFDRRIQLVNLWGTSETTLAKTYYLVQLEDKDRQRIPVGKPIKGARVIILDKDMNVCDEGVVGEAYIRTPFRTFGYYNDPHLTESKFIQNPFSDTPGDLIHKTGDLGRFLEDGNIEIIGRVDRQVKIRGARIELEEIEAVITQYPPVKEAVVIKKSNSENEALCAYITEAQVGLVEENIMLANLNEYLVDQLPDYMIPAAVMVLEEVPRTPHGKVDYESLPDPFEKKSDDYEPPANDIEKILAGLWSDILGIRDISVNAHFFKLGGNSLNIMTLVTKVHKEFDVRISLAEIFDNPSIREQAKVIEMSGEAKFELIKKAPQKDAYPLSSAQKRLFLVQQIEKGNMAYNIPYVMLLEGEVDRDRLNNTFHKLFRRHEIFRTCFKMVDDEPMQVISAETEFEVDYRELEPLPDGSTRAVNDELINELFGQFEQPFDLEKAPLMRSRLVKLGAQTHIFMLEMHHIITDGSSMIIFLEDLIKLYDGQELPEPRIQYRDYSEWQNSPTEQAAFMRQENYWLNEFSGDIPKLNLPVDYARSTVQSFTGKRHLCRIEPEITVKLEQMANREEATLFMVSLSILYILLSKVSGDEDIIIGTGVAGRIHVDLQPLIGLFVNTLALRNCPEGKKSYTDFLREVKARTLQAFENQQYPFELLVSKVALDRSADRNPMFDVMFTFQNMERSDVEVESISGLKITEYNYKSAASKFDLNVIAVREGTLHFGIEYNTKLFKEETIELFARYLGEIAAAVGEEPGKTIAELKKISAEKTETMMSLMSKDLYPDEKTREKKH